MRVISDKFARMRADGRRALICYITAGHPDYDGSLRLLRELPGAGADIIELGIPFSDPLADGVVIQGSAGRALSQGMTLSRALDLVNEAKSSAPIVLFSYLNPLLSAGEGLMARAANAGVHGILVTDLPVGADSALESRFGSGELEFIRLVAPTTPSERMEEISKHGSGFVYLISRMGVTGERDELPTELPATVDRLRGATSLPICVGFGVATAAHARSVAAIADGVIVGSALVRAADRSVDDALSLVRELRQGIDSVNG